VEVVMPRFFFLPAVGVVKFTAWLQMNDNPPKQLFGRRGKKILLVLVCLLVLVIFAVLLLDLVAKSQLNRYERQWEARGEHFDFASFVPQPVPDDQNFALTPIVASSYESILDKNGHRVVPFNTNVINRLEMEIHGEESLAHFPTNSGNQAKGLKADLKEWQLYYRELATKTNEFPVTPQEQSPAADVLLALSKYDEPIEELRQAATLPYSRFPLNYDSDFPALILLPHLAAMKRCAQVLELRAIAELQNGESDKALADVKLMLRLTDSFRTDPFLISHLVRIAMLNLSIQPVWEGLQDHKWSDAQLAELNRELAKQDFLADYEFSMRGERALSIASIEHLRHTRDFSLLETSLDGSPVSDDVMEQVGKVALHLVPNSVFYQNELTEARAIQEWYLPIVDVGQHRVSPAQALLAQNKVEALGDQWSPNTLLARMLLPALGSYAKKCAYGQSWVDMARVACALERCRLAQGNYPETLDALAPRFIEALPPDVIGGQPLKYHRMDNGTFALYSIGWNGTDDGGTVVIGKYSGAAIDYEQGDWVWSGQVMDSQ
jgi:hypothetical protein